MTRSAKDRALEEKILKKINVGDRVQYTSPKNGIVKTGTITKLTEYKGRYGSMREYRVYNNYTSVTICLDVPLDTGRRHISVSPRNLKKIRR